MAAVKQSGWRRVISGVASRAAGRPTAAEAEILRQLSDVFKELAHLSADIGAVWLSLEDVKEKLDRHTPVLVELADMVRGETEFGDESLDLLGRLVQSTRARVEVLEATVAAVGER